jgi:hypothetical protein
VQINDGTACGKADDLMAAYPGEIMSSNCDATTDRVRVTVRIRVSLQLLSIVPGFSAFTMTGTASAHPDEGNP